MSEKNKSAVFNKISRRSFLKGAIAAGSALALTGCGETETIVNTVTNTVTVTEKVTQHVKETVTVTEKELGVMPASYRIAFDPYVCTGCLCCEMACAAEHFGAFINRLSAIRISADFAAGDIQAFVCKQCDAASCVTACPVNAIKFDDATGARYIDQDACTLCGKCLEACPFKEDKIAPIKEASNGEEEFCIKCDLCHGRENGPACVEICPRTALSIVLD